MADLTTSTTKLGNRMSSLPIAQFCGNGPRLSQMGAGRAAAQSTAFHALIAKDPKSADLCARLTEDEMAELLTWKSPSDINLGDGIKLDWATAEKEITLGLNEYGSYCEESDPECISVGHMDGGWIRVVGGMRVAYVADAKRSAFTSTDGPLSLQLASYGFAYASKNDCDAFCRGLWILTDGEWQWEEDVVDLNSPGAVRLWERVLASIRNVGGDYGRGQHCYGCYGRFQCPAYVIELKHASEELAVLTGAEPTNESMLKLLDLCERMDDMAKTAKDTCKAYVAQKGPIVDKAAGKAWKSTMQAGRSGLDKPAIEKALGKTLDGFMTKGKPFPKTDWAKIK